MPVTGTNLCERSVTCYPVPRRNRPDLFLNGEKKTVATNLKLLVENMGRVNYGHKLLADTQRKGIRTGVCLDLHFKLNWKQYALDFTWG